MQDGRKAVWSIPYVSVAFFPSLKQNFIAYRSSKVSWRPDCIFEIHQLWQSGFSRVYSNCYCSCSFEAEILKIGQSSHKMYSNNILNFQESTTILNGCTKEIWKLIEGTILWEARGTSGFSCQEVVFIGNPFLRWGFLIWGLIFFFYCGLFVLTLVVFFLLLFLLIFLETRKKTKTTKMRTKIMQFTCQNSSISSCSV